MLGFLDQTRNVLVGVEAALERAVTEGWSMVLEGVHLVPGMVGTDYPGAFVVQCVVAIEDENLHRSHFWVRDQATEGLRPLEKYLDSLPQIREIQDYLVERARRHDVPVIVQRLARPGDRRRARSRPATRRSARRRGLSGLCAQARRALPLQVLARLAAW